MLKVRDLSKNKTIPANFNLFCEGQKGHNTGQKGHNTGQKEHFKDKKDKTRSSRTNGLKGLLFGSVFFPWGRVDNLLALRTSIVIISMVELPIGHLPIVLVKVAYYASGSARFLPKLCSNYARFSRLCYFFKKLFCAQTSQLTRQV